MPETYSELVNRVLRDHEGYTGDGKGGVGDLPVGDRSTARKPIDKRDIREVVLAGETAVQTAVNAAADAVAAGEQAQLAMVDAQGATMLASSRASLLANNTPDIPAGAVFVTRTGGHAFEVVTSGEDATTAGGVKLRVLPGRDGYDIRAFGALGNGGDDTASVVAAIAAASARGGAVVVPAGTFLVNPLTVTAGIAILGYPGSKLARRAVTMSAVLTISGAAGAIVRGLTIDGRATALGTVGRGLDLTGCSGATVEGNKVIDCRDRGIFFRNGADGTANSASVIRGNDVRDISAGHGIDVQDASNVAVENNRVTRTGLIGIRAFGTAEGQARGIAITGNTVIRATGGGIIVPFVTGGTADTSGVWDVLVDGNTVRGTSSNGILVQARGAAISNNLSAENGTLGSHQGILVNSWEVSVTGNIVRGGSGVGIDFGDCRRVICTGNSVIDQGMIGIEINSTEDFVVSGNILRGNNRTTGSGDLAAGILVHAGGGGYTFVGNSINGVVSSNVIRSGPNQRYGIKATAGSGNLRINDNDAQAAGSIRDFEILTPTGEFITGTNNVAREPAKTPAATITIKQVGKMFSIVSGGTPIANIVTDGGTYEIGREIILRFTGAATVAHGTGNIYLSGNANFSAVNGSVLCLARVDAESWVETSRRD